MSKIRKVISSIWKAKFRKDDDYVDRLSRQYTIFIVMCFALLVGIRQYTVQPIECWLPAQFTDSHTKYANTACWINNLYYIPFHNVLPGEKVHRIKDEGKVYFSYYRYVPLILISMALDVFIPRVIWLFLSIRSGIDLGSLVDAIKDSTRGGLVDTREKALGHTVNQMDRYLLTQRYNGAGICAHIRRIVGMICCLCCGKLYGRFLVTGYMIVKILYFVMAVGKIYFINALLDTKYRNHGLYVMKRWLYGVDWDPSARFPPVIVCEFDILHQSRIHYYQVQCALPNNFLNEWFFSFLWLWFFFVAFITAVNFLQWLFSILYCPGHITYVSKLIRVVDVNAKDVRTLRKFARSYLRQDGMFILRLIEMNMGEAVAGEIVCGLWKNYSPERKTINEMNMEIKITEMISEKVD